MSSPASALGVPIPFPFPDAEAARAAVLDRTHRLLQEALKRWPGWNPPPFDPGRLAEVLGIPVQEEAAPDSIDAVFVPLAGQVRSRHRRRFSLCHEIAHSFWDDRTGARYHLRTREPKAYDHSPEIRELERLCNVAAAEMLMPSPWFPGFVEERGFRAVTVTDASEVFDVSLQASALRVLEFAAGPAAIGFFEFAPPPSGRDRTRLAYRAKRVFTTDGFPYLFPPGKSVPDESVVYRSSMRRSEMSGEEVFRLGRSEARVRVSACRLGERLASVTGRGSYVSSVPDTLDPPVVVAVMELAG